MTSRSTRAHLVYFSESKFLRVYQKRFNSRTVKNRICEWFLLVVLQYQTFDRGSEKNTHDQ